MIRMLLASTLLGFAVNAAAQTTLSEQNELLFQQLQQVHGLNEREMRDHLSDRRFSGVPQPAECLRPERQRRSVTLRHGCDMAPCGTFI